MKRVNARLSAMAAALLVLAGAGLPVAHAARPHARITLHMWAWADRNLCAKDFEKAHPDIKVAYSTVDNYVTKAENFGNEYQHWNGLDLSVNARLRAVLLQGGPSTGR